MKKLLILLLPAVICLGIITSSYASQGQTPAATKTQNKGTRNKRNKANKTTAHLKAKTIKSTATAPVATGSEPTSNDMKTSSPKPGTH